MDNLTLYIVTFNCARNPIDVDLFAAHFFHALPHTVTSAPHLIALSLQEIAPIAYAFLGGSYLTPYFTSFRQAVDRAAASRWEDAQYVNVVEEHVGMTGLLVFARSDVAGRIASVQTARVGLGLQEMGNKGAVGARLRWLLESGEETVPLTFVGAHLAPAEDAFERRNEDWRGIVERLVFEGPSSSRDEDSERAGLLSSATTEGEGEGEEGVFTAGYLFLAGDLNYRTSNTVPQPADFAQFPALDADANSPLHYSRLLRDDQLTRERDKARCFQGLSEAPISFPPTYKYKLGARDPREWKFVHTRWPSWCDRILYSSPPGGEAAVMLYRYDALPLFPTSDHRAVALAAAVAATDVQQLQQQQQQQQLAAPFPIDRDWKRKRDEARWKELVVGGLAYLGLTWEGRRILVGMVIGGLGAWIVLRSMFSV